MNERRILAISTFDTTTEGWTPYEDATQTWSSFGNPNGSLQNVDISTGVWHGFNASSAFLGNKSEAFGGTLSWDIYISDSDGTNNDISDVSLTGNGLIIALDLRNLPIPQQWNSYEVKLDARAGWRVETLSGALATNAQILSVVSDLTQLRIRGEFKSGGDTDYLDNVILRSSATPSLFINDARIIEGDSGTKNAIFNVQLSQPVDEIVTVSYSTANGSATSTDFMSKRGTVTFNPNQQRQTIVIPVKGDTAFERDETFSVRLTNPSNAAIIDGTATGTIVNDDLPLPKISINDVSLLEGDSGTKTARFTVTLTGKTEESVSLVYNTANGSARAGSDFISKAGRLTFRASNQPRQTQTISILVKGDNIFEPNETFTVNLSSAANAEIRDNRGTGTIRNDDDRVVRSSVDFADSTNLLDNAAAYINQYLGSSTFKLPELEPSNFVSGLVNSEVFMG